MVTSVSDSKVLPFSVAVTVNEVFASSSPTLVGFTVRAIPVGASSSSVIVVLTEEAVPSVGAGPPPPEGPEMETVKVSSCSSRVSSVVCTVNV